jgi:hypothetical protein
MLWCTLPALAAAAMAAAMAARGYWGRWNWHFMRRRGVLLAHSSYPGCFGIGRSDGGAGVLGPLELALRAERRRIAVAHPPCPGVCCDGRGDGGAVVLVLLARASLSKGGRGAAPLSLLLLLLLRWAQRQRCGGASAVCTGISCRWEASCRERGAVALVLLALTPLTEGGLVPGAFSLRWLLLRGAQLRGGAVAGAVGTGTA